MTNLINMKLSRKNHKRLERRKKLIKSFNSMIILPEISIAIFRALLNDLRFNLF